MVHHIGVRIGDFLVPHICTEFVLEFVPAIVPKFAVGSLTQVLSSWDHAAIMHGAESMLEMSLLGLELLAFGALVDVVGRVWCCFN